jgi:hypothetical protein
MRQLIPVLLLAGLAACVPGDGTGPDTAVITVRLYDDRGANAGRNQVTVTGPSSMRLETRTQNDGIVHLRVTDPGVYRIQVTPRDGFAGSDELTRDVTVARLEHVVATFTLNRTGTTSVCPCRD